MRWFVYLLVASISRAGQPDWLFVENGSLRLGIDRAAGGAIGWFGSASDNVLNTYDVGRYVQQSFYGDEDGSDWNGTPWRFNPVQGGSWRDVPSLLLELQQRPDGSVYTKTRPRNWAGGELVSEMLFEQTVRVNAAVAVLQFFMHYTGSATHQPRHQELPAVFVDPKYATLVFFNEQQVITRCQPGAKNEYLTLGKPWAAWEAADGTAVGISFPHTPKITAYRVTGTGKADCSYLAPIQTIALKPDLRVSHETRLTLGTVPQIQARFQSN
jgi:hypothetical protein